MYTQFYLETNALRQLSKSLSSLSSKCFTSGLSILELIAGINEKEYDLRRVVVTNIFKSGILIDWNLLENITANSFTGCNYIDHKLEDLKVICKTLIESESLDVFIQKSNNLKYDLIFFENLDQEYSDKFINATSNGNKHLKETLESIKLGNFSEITFPFAKTFIKELSQMQKLNDSMTLNSISENLADGIEFSTGTKIDRESLFNSYNGNINIFIKAFSKYVANKSAIGSLPKKNDFIDLHHLMYLGNSSKIAIVTDDKLIRSINIQTLTIDEFKKVHFIN